MQNDIAFWIAAIILGALGLLLTISTKYLINYLHERVSLLKDDRTKNLLNSLIDLAGEKVLMIEQTVISGIKKDLESGKIKKDDLPSLLLSAKQQAINAVVRDASALGSWNGAISLFGKSEAAERWIADVVESHVNTTTPSARLANTFTSPTALAKAFEASKPEPEAVMLAK